MEDIKTQFIGIGCDIIDINEKCSKMHTKDIDALFTNVIQLNKKNALLKKIYDLEENISKMRVAITKATLSGVANTVIVPETTTGGKVIAEEPIIAETTATETSTVDVDPVEDKSAKKSKSKKKEEVVETPKETAVETSKPSKKKEETSKSTKKKKEEEVPVVKEPVVEIVSTDTAVTKQPVQEVATASEEGEQQPLHLKRKKIPHHIRTYVWNEYIGPDVAQSKCLCCKKEDIRIRNFHCGHVIAESKGGDLTIKNLRPICAACNISMGTMSMNEFTKTFFGWEV